MAVRRQIDCRRLPGADCTLVLAGAESEVLHAATTHLKTIHGFEEAPELDAMLLDALEDERPTPWEPGRRAFDFRTFPGETGTLTIEGDEEEVMEAAAAYAVSGLGFPYSTQLMHLLRGHLRNQSPVRQVEPPAP